MERPDCRSLEQSRGERVVYWTRVAALAMGVFLESLLSVKPREFTIGEIRKVSEQGKSRMTLVALAD